MYAGQKRKTMLERRGKSAYLKGQKALAVRMVPRPMRPARNFSGPLPNKVSATLIYCNTVSVNPGAAAWGANVYSANGLFQCDTTGGVGQPRGRDELFELYNHAYVTSSYITVRSCGNGTDTLLWGVAVRDDATAFTDLRDFGEYRNSKMRMIGADPVEQTIVQVCSPHKFLGLKDAYDDSLRNTITAGPTEALFYHVGAVSATAGDPDALRFIVRIVYHVVFTEPKPMSAS